ncbi:MAG: transcription-repair coupling factor, partial [Candidatus Thiodiazotropha sp.]
MSQAATNTASPFQPPLPQADNERLQWGQLYGCGGALAIANAALNTSGLLLVVAQDVTSAIRLERELRFFLGDAGVAVINFPDWETLPYDLFSPLPELISQRLLTLYRLPQTRRGVLITPISTLMQRLPPQSFLEAHSLIVERGQQLNLEETRARLQRGGYQCVSQVLTHGEFAVRGSLIDIFPMGSPVPYRIDLFDDEVDTIRTFDAETQRSA